MSPLPTTMSRKIFFAVAFCFASASAKFVHISSPVITNWGAWGHYEPCPPGTYVYGFQLIAESTQGFFGGDSALNGINLLCISPAVRRNASTSAATKISSAIGHEGYPRRVMECPDPYFANGFQLRSENFQGWYVDDTAANNLLLHCTNGRYIVGDGESRGLWTGIQKCPRGLVICGIQTQVEEPSKFDDTALNNVMMGCCEPV
ncbi:unnamed protein product [Allacma fusca]|uniref:Vitelline membrane outer layer protein 1 n=1 Tax=Allacma fusca TaxID=39272 RepID=A0A8J2L743_9HEXA|nr:unnamed protein product [Allacma fusca]